MTLATAFCKTWEVSSHGKLRQALTLMSDIVFVSYDLRCNGQSSKEDGDGRIDRGTYSIAVILLRSGHLN